jgi:hypothetical protein
MASPAAQQMLSSLSPDEQARVMASIAGNPNGLDDWYQGAARAGDPRAIRAGGQGQSEDFARFNEGTVTGWAQGYYDEAASRAAGRPQFRSMRGAEGFFDKPTECPPGMGPSGPNESDPCTSQGYSGTASGVVGPAGGAQVTGGRPAGTGGLPANIWMPAGSNPLGGSWNPANNPGKNDPLTGLMAAPNSFAAVKPAPQTSTLERLMGGISTPAVQNNPLVGAMAPLQGGFASTRAANPLGQQKRKLNQGGWF